MLILGVMFFAIIGTGCENKTDDRKYGFEQYLLIRDNGNSNYSTALLSKSELENSTLFEKYHVSYAVDQKGDLYSYSIKRDKKDKEYLECKLVLEGAGKIKDFTQNLGYVVCILLENGDLYAKKLENTQDWDTMVFSKPLLSNIESISLTWSGGIQCHALTKDGDLYAWGYYRPDFETQYNYYEPRHPKVILNDVSIFFLVKPEKAYQDFKCAALTGSGDLYCWGISGGKYIKTYRTPELILDNVESIMPREENKGIIALKDGKEIEVNARMHENPNNGGNETKVNEKDLRYTYRNTKNANNKWDSIFDNYMVSLKGTYDDGFVQSISGEICNSTDKKWNNCKLTFALFDGKDEVVAFVSAVVGATDAGKLSEFQVDERESLFRYKAVGFELMEIIPNAFF